MFLNVHVTMLLHMCISFNEWSVCSNDFYCTALHFQAPCRNYIEGMHGFPPKERLPPNRFQLTESERIELRKYCMCRRIHLEQEHTRQPCEEEIRCSSTRTLFSISRNFEALTVYNLPTFSLYFF